jgi:hypothetical protein
VCSAEIKWTVIKFKFKKAFLRRKFGKQNKIKIKLILKMLKRVIDGRSPIYIEIEKVSSRSTSNQLVSRMSSDIILEKKWMDKEEMKEIHLVAAINKKEPIPVPDIVEIDEEIYDKLYPANYKKTKWRIIAERENKLFSKRSRK